MVNNTELVKLELLKKKIDEFFRKNKETKSAIFELAVDERVTRWKVERFQEGLKITEIKRLLSEAPVGQVQAREDEFMQAQQQALAQQMAAQQPPPPPLPSPPGMAMEPLGMAQVPSVAMPGMPMPPVAAPMPQAPMPPAPEPVVPPPGEMVPEPPPPEGKPDWSEIIATIEKGKQIDPQGFMQMFGATPQAQLSNPNAPPSVVTDTEPSDERAGQKIAAGRTSLKGKLLREQPPGTMPPMSPQPAPGVQPAQPSNQQPGEPQSTDVPFQPGVSEESALLRALKGQTIKDVKLENDAQKVILTFNLVTTRWPVIFEWSREGKLTLTSKDRRYTLQRGWR